MKPISNHLGFDGQCLEAMTFYAKCLGAELSYMTYGEAPMPCGPDMPKDRIMHSRLMRGNQVVLMGADCPPGMNIQAGTNITLSLGCDSIEEADRVFAALGDGGKVTMPMGETFFAPRFGMLKDRYGISWMLLAGEKPVTLKSASVHAAAH